MNKDISNKKPNILFIFTDQLRGDSIGIEPNSQVITPNLNRLAQEGISFSRCMGNAPLCVPARTALMTGQLIRENAIWSNRIGADPHGPSHVRNIRDVGYHTSVIGKTHLWRHSAAGKPGQHVLEMEHNLHDWGFEYTHELNDPIETAWMGCHYTDYLEEKGWLEDHRSYIQAWVEEMRTGNITPWGQEPAPVPEGEDIDSYIGRTACEWIRDYEDTRPFYLQVQFTGPHDPFDGPQPYRNRYDPSQLDIGIHEPHDPPTQAIEALWRRAPSVHKATTYQRQRWRAWYYANITLIDDWIGKILYQLKDKGHLDNTWVMFNSDHGEMLGDHGLSSKAVFYEQAVRVPCIIRPPTCNGSGLTSNALVEHIDLPATMLDIAEAKPLQNSLGRSLLSYLRPSESGTKDANEKEAVISELFGQSTVITEKYKLTVRVDDHRVSQFFDLTNDPNELQNVRNDPHYKETIASLVEEFVRPLDVRIDQSGLRDYRDYVRRTGSVN